MTDNTPKPLLPLLGDHRPTRLDVAPMQSAGATGELLQFDHRPMHMEVASIEGAEAPVALTLPPADPASAPPRAARSPMHTTASVVAAWGAHLLVLFSLISVPAPQYGGGGSGQDAISVSIIPATALVAREPVSDAGARSALAQMAPETGEDVVESTTAREEPRPPDEARERLADEHVEPDERLAAPAEPAPEVVHEEAPKLTSPPTPPEETKVSAVEPPRPDPPKKDAPPPEHEPAQPAPEARTAGGETSIGSAHDHSPQPAAANASRGQLFAYGLAVQAALLAVDQREAKALLSASRVKGTVVVKLVLDRNGALARVEVVKSSGNPRLDEVALLLTRRAAFPPPPPELTTAELAYTAPVQFR